MAFSIILTVLGLGAFCALLYKLAVYALPSFVLCGRPHKTNYVAFCDMWRGRGDCFCGAR